MKKPSGAKKTLRTLATVMALAAALATTGCTGGTLLGPEKETEAQGQVTPQQGGQHVNMGGQRVTP